MDAKLKERAQVIATYRNLRTRPTEAMIAETAEVYRLMFGKTVDCNGCNFYSFINEISSKLIQEPLIIKDMANAKIVFKHNATSREVIRHTKNGTIKITPENLNEGDNAAFMLEFYSHLIEESKAAKTEPSAEGKPSAPVKAEAKTSTTAKGK